MNNNEEIYKSIQSHKDLLKQNIQNSFFKSESNEEIKKAPRNPVAKTSSGKHIYNMSPGKDDSDYGGWNVPEEYSSHSAFDHFEAAKHHKERNPKRKWASQHESIGRAILEDGGELF